VLLIPVSLVLATPSPPTSEGTDKAVLSQHADEGYAFELLRGGTAGLGYLLKERVGDLDDLFRAIREVMAGRSVIDPKVVDGLVARQTRISTSAVHQLTPRERDVLAEMAQGKTNAAIGESLHLSLSAVEKHVNAIFTTLGLTEEAQVNKRVAAVLLFLRDSGLSSA
jgi:DNA-binding NarL/FixJ family response regulator